MNPLKLSARKVKQTTLFDLQDSGMPVFNAECVDSAPQEQS